MKPFTAMASIFLIIISVLHMLRVVFDADIVINGWYVPFWMNGVAAVITGTLAVMLLKEKNR